MNANKENFMITHVKTGNTNMIADNINGTSISLLSINWSNKQLLLVANHKPHEKLDVDPHTCRMTSSANSTTNII